MNGKCGRNKISLINPSEQKPAFKGYDVYDFENLAIWNVYISETFRGTLFLEKTF